MLSIFPSVSDDLWRFICERGAIYVQENMNIQREVQGVLKKNFEYVEPFMEESIRTLTFPGFLGKPAIVTLEAAKIKALFFWVLENCEKDTGDSLDILQKQNNIFKRHTQRAFSICKSEIARTSIFASDKDKQTSERERHAAVEELYMVFGSIINPVCFLTLSMLIKYYVARRTGNKANKKKKKRQIQSDLNILYIHLWCWTDKQRQEYYKFLAETEPNAQETKRLWYQNNVWKEFDYSKLFQRFDSLGATKAYYQKGVKGENDWFFFSAVCATQCMYESGSLGYIYAGDFFRPGISKAERADLNRAFCEGLVNFQKYLEINHNISDPNDMVDGEDNYLYEYLNQCYWFLKIIHRQTAQSLNVLRQYILQMWILRRTGQQATIDRREQEKAEKAKRDAQDWEKKAAALQQENDELLKKVHSLSRRCNYLSKQLEEKDIASLEGADTEDFGSVKQNIQELEAIEIENVQQEEVDDVDWIAACNEMIQNKSVFVIGGNENLLKNLTKAIPGISIIDKNRSTPVNDAISHADFVFFRYSALSHPNYWRIRKLCRSWNIPYGYLSNYTAIRLLAKDMCEKMVFSAGKDSS